MSPLFAILYITVRATNKEGNMYFIPTPNSRDTAIGLVEEGVIDWETLARAALSYMSTDDVDDMLDANELSERFMEAQ
jgi:hypothetical protein